MSNYSYCLYDDTGTIHLPARGSDVLGVVACGKIYKGYGSFLVPPERLVICFECYKFHHGKEPEDDPI